MADRFEDACPMCGAQGDEQCATATGRDHRKRSLLMIELDRQRAANVEVGSHDGR